MKLVSVFKYRIFVLILLALATGCIAPEVRTGNPSEYELQGLNNTSIFYLNVSSVQVIENVANATSVDFPIGGNVEPNFRNPIAVDYSGNNVSFNVSEELILGKNYARFVFSSPFSGFVAFTQPAGQDFMYPLTKNGAIRAVLPVNYTVRSFLGIAQPKPDTITQDASGREVLIWVNPYPEHNSIRVKYSHKEAPTLVFYFLFSLSIAAVLVLGYYYMSLSGLKKKRERMEKDVRK